MNAAMVVLVIFAGGSTKAHDDSCRYANDGECDKPQFCARGGD